MFQIGRDVLVIGDGASGVEIVRQLSRAGANVTLSRHERPDESENLRKRREKLYECKLKDDVRRVTAYGVEFEDGSNENFNAIIYATDVILKNVFEFCFLFLNFSQAMNINIHFWIKILEFEL